MRTCGLLGGNIKYSISPSIHNEYYKIHNIPLNYKIFDIEEKNIIKFISDLRKENIIGFNVTIPFKEEIIKYLQFLEYPANKIGAVNTVLVKSDSLVGYNTDYYGFSQSLKERNIELENKNALIIGKGGSARCVFYALKDMKVKSIDFLTRTLIKDNFFEDSTFFLNEEYLNLDKYDIIINCTPLGGSNYKDELPLELKNIKKGLVVYDLNYVPEKSKLLESAEKLGAEIINGTSMLKYQAYKAIEIWKSNFNRGGF